MHHRFIFYVTFFVRISIDEKIMLYNKVSCLFEPKNIDSYILNKLYIVAMIGFKQRIFDCLECCESLHQR